MNRKWIFTKKTLRAIKAGMKDIEEGRCRSYTSEELLAYIKKQSKVKPKMLRIIKNR